MLEVRTAPGVETRQFEIRDRVAIMRVPPGAIALDLWCPLIVDSPYQRVLDIAVESPAPVSVGHDADHGNAILNMRLERPLPSDVSLSIRYRVERAAVEHRLDPTCVRGTSPRQLFARHLAPERHVEVTSETRALAQQIVGGEQNDLERARRIYDHVVGYMTYDAAEQSWVGSTQHALACTVGNCNDIHALFISLCRSIGIPARLVMGQALETPQPGEEPCEICGYHCWAEFFVAGLGWLPADASCACKYDKHHLFGNLELNHIAWSIGRDILLQPAQRGDRLLYFVAPYAEVDGRVHQSVSRGITFTDV
jgi:transglutaminase-like putative cysteine protease